jgi:hypothetical protein
MNSSRSMGWVRQPRQRARVVRKITVRLLLPDRMRRLGDGARLFRLRFGEKGMENSGPLRGRQELEGHAILTPE